MSQPNRPNRIGNDKLLLCQVDDLGGFMLVLLGNLEAVDNLPDPRVQ